VGLVEDKNNQITKRGNFKEGKLFGLGEVKEGSNLLIRGQFGPAEKVEKNWRWWKYVTSEGELLIGTAFIKETIFQYQKSFLTPEAY